MFREINSAIAFYFSFLIGALIPFWLFKEDIGLSTLVVNDTKKLIFFCITAIFYYLYKLKSSSKENFFDFFPCLFF